MNKVELIGNAGMDPEIKKLEGGYTLAKFSLATSKRTKVGDEWKDSTVWHNIVAFRELADTVAKLVKKGLRVSVIGELTYKKFTDKEGVTKYFTEIVANQVVAQ
jgi:single-strand DNA-binding protein